MLIGGAEGHEACHRARKGMLIGGAERQEAYHWARYGMLIGGADGHEACHRARFGKRIGGADKHEACHWATQRAMAGLRTAARERREFDRVLCGIAIQACPGISLTSRGNLHRRSPPQLTSSRTPQCKVRLASFPESSGESIEVYLVPSSSISLEVTSPVRLVSLDDVCIAHPAAKLVPATIPNGPSC